MFQVGIEHVIFGLPGRCVFRSNYLLLRLCVPSSQVTKGGRERTGKEAGEGMEWEFAREGEREEKIGKGSRWRDSQGACE